MRPLPPCCAIDPPNLEEVVLVDDSGLSAAPNTPLQRFDNFALHVVAMRGVDEVLADADIADTKIGSHDVGS
jgi:hypothetical protein